MAPSISKLQRPLQVGSRGANVLRLERALKQQGMLQGPVDRSYGAQTQKAVQRFERAQGWKTDGIVGNRLWHKLLGGTPPAGTAESSTFKTLTINIKSNPEMAQSKVVHDVRKAAATQAGLIGWNEIGPARYVSAIKALGPQWGHYFPRDGKLRIPNPISWKKSIWDKVDDGFMRTHNGLAKVSPHRYITWVKLKNKQTGKTIIRMNTHLVSGAWSSRKPTTEWRRQMWNIHMTKMKALVAKFEKQGHIIVVGGDFNRDSYRVLGNQVAYDNKLHVGTLGKSTLDYVMHTKDEDIRRIKGRVQRGYESDHDAVVVKYKLHK